MRGGFEPPRILTTRRFTIRIEKGQFLSRDMRYGARSGAPCHMFFHVRLTTQTPTRSLLDLVGVLRICRIACRPIGRSQLVLAGFDLILDPVHEFMQTANDDVFGSLILDRCA